MKVHTPQNRSISALKQFLPTKCTSQRKQVLIEGEVVADGTIAVMLPHIPGSQNCEPFLNPARVEIIKENAANGVLAGLGFFMYGSCTLSSIRHYVQTVVMTTSVSLLPQIPT